MREGNGKRGVPEKGRRERSLGFEAERRERDVKMSHNTTQHNPRHSV